MIMFFSAFIKDGALTLILEEGVNTWTIFNGKPPKGYRKGDSLQYTTQVDFKHLKAKKRARAEKV